MISADTVAVRYGPDLRAAIEEAGLTFAEVARHAGVSPTWISHLCADRSRRRRVATSTALIIGGLVSPLTPRLFVLDDKSLSDQADPGGEPPHSP